VYLSLSFVLTSPRFRVQFALLAFSLPLLGNSKAVFSSIGYQHLVKDCARLELAGESLLFGLPAKLCVALAKPKHSDSIVVVVASSETNRNQAAASCRRKGKARSAVGQKDPELEG